MFLGLVATFLVLQKNSYGVGGKDPSTFYAAPHNGGVIVIPYNPAAPQQFEMEEQQNHHFHSYNSFSASPITNDPVSLRRVAEEQINILQSV